MDIPSGALRHAAVDLHRLNVRRGNSETYAAALLEHDPAHPDIATLIQQFHFAGATSVNCHILLGANDILPVEWRAVSTVKARLTEMYGDQLFTGGLRPPITDEPQLVAAAELDARLVLTYVFTKGERRVWQNYAIRKIANQRVEFVVLHFNPFMVEIRAPLHEVDLFRLQILKLVGLQDRSVDWEPLTRLNDYEVGELARRLGATLTKARHKSDGPYDYEEVAAAEDVDLLAEPDYQERFNGRPMRKKVLKYKHRYSWGYEDEVRYVVTGSGSLATDGQPSSGNIVFKSTVGEEVILRFIRELQDIRREKMQLILGALTEGEQA